MELLTFPIRSSLATDKLVSTYIDLLLHHNEVERNFVSRSWSSYPKGSDA